MTVATKQFITRDIVVFLNQEGVLLGLDHRRGWELWRMEFSLTKYPYLVDLVEVAGRVYFITVEKDYAVHALNPYTDDHHHKVPAISTHPEQEGILCMDAGEGKQHMLSRATGELKWIFDTNTLVVKPY